MHKKYIKLDSSERSALEALRKESSNRRVRDRAHALLLSDSGHDVTSLCSIFEVYRPAIYSWMKRWESSGLEGLKDKPGRGRKKKLTPSEEKKL